jgi:hypothetical protein
MLIHRGWVGTRSLSLAALATILIAAFSASGQQDSKSWMELRKKDAEHLLADSPWSQTQVDTDASEMFYSPTRQGSASPGRPTVTIPTGQQSVNNNRADRGAVNQVVNVSYRICFLSARPIRQAFAKMILSKQEQPDDRLISQLQAFVERDFSPYIVIAVSVESNDQRFTGPIMQAINSGNTGSLKNNAYLERQDGKRLFLSEYIPPIADGLGAKFIFPRLVDGVPFLSSDSGTVRFFAQFNDSFKLNMTYKVSDMIFDQRLEY